MQRLFLLTLSHECVHLLVNLQFSRGICYNSTYGTTYKPNQILNHYNIQKKNPRKIQN